MKMAERAYEPSEMAELDLKSIEDEKLPDGHKSGFVAVAGRPNVGKSTLMNALLNQKVAIVTERPQTTRHKQMGILTSPEFQIIFVDTPGLIKPRHELDEYMVTVAHESVRDADMVLWLVDAAEPPGLGDKAIAETFKELPVEKTVILAINKADLVKPATVISRTEEYRGLLPQAPWLLFSALNGSGLDELLAMIIDALPEGPRFYPIDQTTDFFVRDVAAELIREQIFIQMRDELPYGTTVIVEQFKERDDAITYINATIYVERESHKKIIIGTKGSQLRSIGTAARRTIEELVGGKVFLDLWVKVEPNWRKSATLLKRLGYGT
jgi:GTP-binding protein Era